MAETELTGNILTAAATVLAAGGAAFFGGWLSSRRYRAEHIWDKKLEAYTAIFQAINQLLEELDFLLDEEMRLTHITPEFRSKLADEAALARTELRRQSRIGTFLISAEAEALIKQLLIALEKHSRDSYFDTIDSHAAAITRTAGKLKEVARRDLKA